MLSVPGVIVTIAAALVCTASDIAPNDAESTYSLTRVVGSQAFLLCYTSLNESVVWAKYEALKERPFEDIYVNGKVINGFVGRFSVDNAMTGSYHLAIDNITLDDAGLYSCSENNGFGPAHYIKLMVSERAHSHSTHTGTMTVSLKIGELAVLPCYPNKKVNVQWVYHSLHSTKPVHEISVSGRIRDDFLQRFSLSVAHDGRYNLIISNSQQSDAGLYICMEEDGVGRTHYVQLNITETLKTVKETAQNANISLTADVIPGLGECDYHTREVAIIVLSVVIVVLFLSPAAFAEHKCNPCQQEEESLPLTPTRLDVSEVTTSSVKLTWNPGNNNSIIIQYKQKIIEETTCLEIHDVTGTEYTVVGLNANTVYEFRAFAVNAVGRSPPSSPLDVTTREQVDCSDVEQSDTTLPIANQQKPVWKENITEGNRNVRNFAKLRDKTYVAFRQKIDEYLDHFDKPNRTIPIPEEVCCKYFSAHITSNCLYIADDQNRCVWRTKLDPSVGDNDRTTKWYSTTYDNKNIECVAVRNNEEIVVLLRDEFWGGHYWKGQLVICNMNGEGTKTINLLPDLINPYAVTCTSPQEGTFLVAFEGGLKEINVEGRSVGFCCREFKLTHPRKCYYDRASKCTFVIDVGHKQLLQLDRNLSSPKTVMQWTSNGDAGLDSHPVRVHYDSETKQLTVGMLSGRISVFKYSV